MHEDYEHNYFGFQSFVESCGQYGLNVYVEFSTAPHMLPVFPGLMHAVFGCLYTRVFTTSINRLDVSWQRTTL